MSEQISKDGAQDAPKEPELPIPEIGGSSEVQRSESDLETRLARLLDERLEKYRRDIQGQTDKALHSFEKRVGSVGVLDEFRKLTQAGYTEREAEMALQLRELQESKSTADESVQGRTESREPQPKKSMTSEEVKSVLDDAELDATRPEVISLLQTKYPSREAFEAAAYKLGKQLNKPRSPSLSAAPATGGGSSESSAVNPKVERLTELQKNPSVNRWEIKRLKEELDKEGWEG